MNKSGSGKCKGPAARVLGMGDRKKSSALGTERTGSLIVMNSVRKVEEPGPLGLCEPL